MSSPNGNHDTAAVTDVIVDHLRRHAPALAGSQVDATTPVLESGALDSLGILQLTMLLGETFNVEIEDEDFVPENFGTVSDIARFIVRKQTESA